MTTTDAPNARFCKDCRYSRMDEVNPSCHAPQNQKRTFSLVTGAEAASVHFAFCETQRNSPARSTGDNCGIEGRWFEPREDETREAAE